MEAQGVSIDELKAHRRAAETWSVYYRAETQGDWHFSFSLNATEGRYAIKKSWRASIGEGEGLRSLLDEFKFQ